MEFLTEHYLILDCGSTHIKGVLYKSGPQGNFVVRTEIAPQKQPGIPESYADREEESEEYSQNTESERDSVEEVAGEAPEESEEREAESESAGDLPIDDFVNDSLSRSVAEFARTYFPDEKNVILSLPMERCFVRSLKIPAAKPEQVREMIPFEVEGLIPVGMDDSEVVGILNKPVDEITGVSSFTSTHHWIGGTVGQLIKEGYHPRMLIPEAAGLASLIRLLDQGLYADRVIAQIDMGGRSTLINFLVNGELVFTRTLPFGGDDITEVIAEILNIEYDLAEKIKLDLDWNPSLRAPDGIRYENDEGETKVISAAKSGKIHSAIVSRLNDLIREIQRSIMITDVEGPALYLLSGGASLLAGTSEYLQEKLEVPVNPYPLSIESGGDFKAWATAIGVWEHSRLKQRERADFLSTPFGKSLRRGEFHIRDISPPLWLGGAALVFILASFFVGMMHDRRSIQDYRAKISAIASTIPGVGKKGDPVTQAIDICKTRLRGSSYGSGEGRILDLMEKVGSLFPASDAAPLRFKKFAFNGKNIEVELEMDSLTDVTVLQKELEKSRDFKDLSVDSDIRADRKVKVEVRMTPVIQTESTGVDCK